jgi:hypothetical protein
MVRSANSNEPVGNYGFHAKLRRRQNNFDGHHLRGIFLADANVEDVSFENANLEHWQLVGGTFERCSFKGAKFKRLTAKATRFRHCSFDRAVMDFADLRMVDFDACSLEDTSFRYANMETVAIADSYLAVTSFASARLDGVRFNAVHVAKVDVARTHFVDCDVEVFTQNIVPDLVRGASFDWKTVSKSLRAVKLQNLLRTAGTPEIVATYMIDAAKALDPALLFKLMRSTFISYGAPDARFARILRDKLQANGVRTFFFETDATPGERLHHVMRRGVNEHDRVVLICSAASLDRPGVRNEIEETLDREARDGGATYLIPIVLDDYLFEWKDPLGIAIRNRVVADFREPKPKPGKRKRKRTGQKTGQKKKAPGNVGEVNPLDTIFDDGLVRLLRALRI